MENSIRVAYENWMPRERFDELLGMLGKHRCGITMIALFTSAVHSPLTLDELSRRAEIMRERMMSARAAGFSAGINILATIGHHSEDLAHSPLGLGYRNMTGMDGSVCEGCYCMNDGKYISGYIDPAYQTLVAAEPDFIWIDDDVRSGHMGSGYGCFCDGCVDLFNRENGTSFDRESLKKELDGRNMDIRRRWMKHNSDSMVRLVGHIARTVRSLNPGIQLGHMIGDNYMEGINVYALNDALSENGKYEIFFRPGGGAYSDANYQDILYKAWEIAGQVSLLPPYVKLIHSEVENFPYQLLKKTPLSTACEGLMYIQSGCSGAAFNMLPSETGEPITNILPHLKEIDRHIPIYNALEEHTRGLSVHGIHSSWRPDNFLYTPAGDWGNMRGWHSTKFCQYGRELLSAGLPECFRPDCAEVFLLTENSAEGYTDDELKKILSGGVYVGASAAAYLTGRGFGKYLGFDTGRDIPVDAREEYVNHEMNRGITGCRRNCRQAFNHGESHELIPLDDKCEILSRLVDYHDRVLAGACTGLYENELGGRVCVSTYYPFEWVSDYPKTVQLKRIFRYLSRDTLPAYVDSYTKSRCIVFTDGKRVVPTICNTTNDAETDVRVAIRTESDTAVFYGTDGSPVTHRSVYADGAYRMFDIDRIDPFETVFLECE